MENKKIKSFIIKIIIMAIISGMMLLMSGVNEKSQYIKHLDYKVALNKDGSMRVTETWDINVNHTNTLFRDFKLSSIKYGDITDVEVVDLDKGIKLKQIDEEMYHVTKDCFYALNVEKYKFEIAWGAGLDNEFKNKKYQISYTVNDVVTDYKDFQEIYWQFLAKGQNDIPVSKITGIVTLPENVSDVNKLRVWGHGQLNGKIEKTNTNKVSFKVNNLNPGSMLEIRVATEDKMFNVGENKTRNYNYLNTAIREETKWADEANQESENANKFLIIIGIIYVVIILIYIKNIIKYLKITKQEGDGLQHNKIKYFRDIPRENNSTPAEAAYLYNFDKKRIETAKIQSQTVASTILNLCLKKVVSLRAENNNIYVKLISHSMELKDDELAVYNLLRDAGKYKEEICLNELNTYAKKEYTQYSNCINKIVDSARKSLYNLKLIDKQKEKSYSRYENAEMKHFLFKNIYEFLVVTYMVSHIPILRMAIVTGIGIGFLKVFLEFLIITSPILCIMLYAWKLQTNIKNKIAVLTQAGSDEKEQWKGLANYMKDFSLLDEQEVPQLAIWEKYLVFATAFGIADDVIKQMKAKYPQVFVKETWDDDEILNNYPIIYFTMNPIHNCGSINPISRIGSDINKAYHTSITEIAAHSSSSGSGGRWRFLWRRRRPVEAGGRNGRKIKKGENMIDFKQQIAQAISKITNLDEKELQTYIEVPKDSNNGDYAFPCFRLAKELKKAPPVIATEIKEKIEIDETKIDKIEVVGGYLNFYINKQLLAKEVIEEISKKEKYGQSNPKDKNIVIDYSAPNIAKPFHIGHLRSTVIGGALYNIYKYLGYNVTGINHLGDYGTQFGKLIEGYKLWGNEYNIDEDPINELTKIYIRINNLCKEDEKILEECRNNFKKLEDGDTYCVELWEKFRKLSLNEFQKVYDILGSTFDSWNGEAFYSDKMQEIVDILEKTGKLVESEGARIIDLEDKGINTPCIIEKTNRSTTYATRDLAAILYRARTYNFDKALYVTSYEQVLHFKQVFETAKLLGLDEKYTNGLEHVSFGMVQLPTGKMSTREGNIVKLEDLLNEAVQRASEIIEEKNPQLENKQDVARKVGIGAVIFNDLANSRIKDEIFDWNTILNFQGETGPYIQYTYVRTKSVLEKVENKLPQVGDIKTELLTDEYSNKILKLIYNFEDILMQVTDKNEPSILSRYLIELAKSFSAFYNENKIIVEDKDVQNARIYLTYTAGKVLKIGSNLLGIEMPDKM